MGEKEDIKFMTLAYKNAKKLSEHPNTQIGAVISLNGKIISSGVNRTPLTLKFEKYMAESENKSCYLQHAERNAIAFCVRKGITTKKATMYTLWEPCASCALMIIDAGIKELVLHKQLNDYYRENMKDEQWIKEQKIALELLKKSGVKIRYLDKKLFKESKNFFINFRGEKFYP